MPEVLVATPLNYSAATRPYDFGDGISIREISPILWDISVVKRKMRQRKMPDIS